jgi:transcriptional regulator with XRE-family HTH domain
MDSTEAIRKLFGERVRYFRKLRGWQLDDLGARLHRSRGSMSRIENGKQNLTMVDIATIAQALEVEVDELFRQSPDLAGMPDVPAYPPEVQTMVHQCAQKMREVSTIADKLERTLVMN